MKENGLVPGQGTTKSCSGEEREVEMNGPRHECLHYIVMLLNHNNNTMNKQPRAL